MCCSSGPVEDVSAARIFARMASLGRQILAYEMELDLDAALSRREMVGALPDRDAWATLDRAHALHD